MAFWIVGLVALVAVVAWAMSLLKKESLGRDRIDAELHASGTPTLEYVVPTGEDPVVVLAALQHAGYTACVDSHGAHQLVLVKCPDGVERSRAKVRSVIESAGVTTPKVEVRAHAAVQFRDEV